MDIIKGFPATSQDNYPLNVTTIIKHAARSFGPQEIVSQRLDGSIFSYTYAKAHQRMKRLASGLEGLGVKPGDRVGVLAWNSHENYEIYFGLPGMGAVMLLLNLRLTPQDLSYVIEHSGASYIIVDETLLPIAHAVAPLCKNIKAFVIITMAGKKLADVQTSLENTYSYEELIDGGSPDYEWPWIEETSAYGACYTTGTTGKPKGVYYSHRNVYLHSCSIGTNSEPWWFCERSQRARLQQMT
jgi:fatty-acyl-CoA synthase